MFLSSLARTSQADKLISLLPRTFIWPGLNQHSEERVLAAHIYLFPQGQ
jgi:hypothetical protein